VGLLAATGTFLWAVAVAVTAGSLAIFYSVTCAALIRLRRIQPDAPGFRVRFGPVFAVAGIAISLLLLTQIELRQLALMSFTALIAAANWLWARRNGEGGSSGANRAEEEAGHALRNRQTV